MIRMKNLRLRNIRMAIANQNGFTLVEALVGVVIMAILAAGISSSLAFGFHANIFVSDELNAIRETRQCLPKIVEELRYCFSIESISSDNSILYYKVFNTNDVLVLCSIYRSPEDGKIYCRRGNNTPVVFSAAAVDQIIFTKNDPAYRTINVSVDVDGKVLSTTVRAMNYGTINQ
jgi:prepilin-type N-terminal cleavage/methylation domain-containing protein